MRRVVLALLALTALASAAQAQTATPSTIVVSPGGSTNLNLAGGSAGQQFAVIASATNSGFSYAGVTLSVGTDVIILATGVLDGSGAAAVPITPPFPAYDRFYYQAVFSSNGFASIAATNGAVVVNAQEARLYMAVGGGVNATGVGFALSPGVTSVRNSAGSYTVTFTTAFGGPNVIPSITPFCGQSPASVTANNAAFTVTFASDCGFFFTATPIRR